MSKFPRCLAELLTRPAEDPGVPLDAVVAGWENVFFSLGCPCGGSAFVVRSFLSPHYYLEHDTAFGPIWLRCTTCGDGRKTFDPTVHGYDAEIDHFPPAGDYRGELTDFRCPHCTGRIFEFTARFQYPDSVLEESGRAPEDRADKRPNPEDMFSYFTLIGSCSACGELSTAASIECS